MQNAIRTTRQVSELLPLSPAEIPALEQLESQYKLAIPPYYFSLIDVDDPQDPIRLQSVPSVSEMSSGEGNELEDPLEEDQDSPVPGLTHRYPDRVLLVATHVCTMYCRFCTRKRVTMDRGGWDAPSRNDQRMIDYIRQHPEINDVILSGGDPLSLPVSKLRWLLQSLAEIDHVGVIRVGTRVPVTLPQRIFDPELVDLLHQAGKVWIQTHFNHPREITPESSRAVRLLVNAGMPVNSHAVLLKGVNDSVPVMRDLMRGLLRIKARPYYLFHCDPVVGAGHFRTSVWKGIEIIEGLRGHVSGLGVPTYVIDGLHGAGKIPVMPNYMLSASPDAVVLRNYEGLIFRYAPEHKEPDPATAYDSQGVSGVLGGSPKPLVPEGNRRLARRLQRQIAADAGEALRQVMADDGGPTLSEVLPVLNEIVANELAADLPLVELGGIDPSLLSANGHSAAGRNGHGGNGHSGNGASNGRGRKARATTRSRKSLRTDTPAPANGRAAKPIPRPKTARAKPSPVRKSSGRDRRGRKG